MAEDVVGGESIGRTICDDEHLVYDEERGELVCVANGMVLEDRKIDYGPEWRVFSAEDLVNRKRVGAPLTRRVHDNGIASFIDPRDLARLHGKRRIIGRKLYRLNRSTRVSKSSRRLVSLLAELNTITGLMNLPRNVRETAAMLLRRIAGKDYMRGKMKKAYLAAAIYVACKQEKIPLTPRELREYIEVSKEDLWRALRRINEDALKGRRTPLMKAVDFIPKLASKLSLPATVQTKAAEIIDAAEKKGLTTGKGGLNFAAAALYVASVVMDRKKTQQEVSQASKVTEVTVRNRYKDIVENLYIEVMV